MALNEYLPPDSPPVDVRQFLERHVRSAAEVELLLLLFRSPETYWTPSAAANVIGADERDILTHFQRLAADGFLERGKLTDAFRFAPQRAEDRDTVGALASAYSDRPDEVLRTVRGAAARSAHPGPR